MFARLRCQFKWAALTSEDVIAAIARDTSLRIVMKSFSWTMFMAASAATQILHNLSPFGLHPQLPQA